MFQFVQIERLRVNPGVSGSHSKHSCVQVTSGLRVIVKSSLMRHLWFYYQSYITIIIIIPTCIDITFFISFHVLPLDPLVQ